MKGEARCIFPAAFPVNNAFALGKIFLSCCVTHRGAAVQMIKFFDPNKGIHRGSK